MVEVDPPARFLLERAQSRGAVIYQGSAVTEITGEGVQLENGTLIRGGKIVNTTGAWAPQLTPGLEIHRCSANPSTRRLSISLLAWYVTGELPDGSKSFSTGIRLWSHIRTPVTALVDGVGAGLRALPSVAPLVVTHHPRPPNPQREPR